MDLGLVLSVASFMVAVAAMIFSVLYSKRAVRIAQASNSIHVIADMFTEVRSREFRALYRTVLEAEYPTDLPNGLASLEQQDQDDVFQLCAYFEHMGSLCYSGLVSSDMVLGSAGYVAERAWSALEHVVRAERRFRNRHFGTPSGRTFMPHFEWLVTESKRRTGVWPRAGEPD